MVLNDVWAGLGPWLIPIISLVGSAVVTAVVGYIIKRSLDKHFDKKDKEDQRVKSEHEELEKIKEERHRVQRQEDLEKAMDKVIKPLEGKIDELHDKLMINSEGTVTILRDRMKSARDCYLTRGYASDSDKANWRELYQSYKSLGGNHFREYVDQWKMSVEELPPHKIRKSKKKEEDK